MPGLTLVIRNHNMDPTIVASAEFGQIFRTKLPGNYNNLGAEQVFSQPLVYTLSKTGKQYVYVLTTQNNLYQLDAKTGAIIQSRSLHLPFLTSDLAGCVDINPTVGVTGTGVIDPATETLYFTSKTYIPGKSSGRQNGEYYFHAVDVNTLEEKPNFPQSMNGILFRNNPRRMFQGGIHHQRTGLLQAGDYIYAGFASHCVQWNFTGAIVGWHKTTGALVEAYAMEGGPEPNTISGAGVWMSGGAMAYDSGSMYFGTGNGYSSQQNGKPVPGRQPPTSLEEAAVNAKINEDGTITPIDFFMPWEKVQLDGADKDLGTSPLVLLPTSTFSCPNAKRLGVITGKSGKTYWLNLDNLGGYQMGPNQLDAIPQQYQNENSVYAGAGVMPLDGGYVYINVIQYKTHVFKFGCDANGNVAFTKVADTAEKNAYVLGVGHGTTTSLNGAAGSGLVWTSDVEGLNLRIYKAVPNASGTLDMIKSFNIPGSQKFGRPVFGDGRAYVASNQGYIYGFGSPVALPLNCTGPLSFGTVNLNNVSDPQTITCTASIQTQLTSVSIVGNNNFAFSGLPTFPLSVAAGSSFTFQARFAPKQVGSLSSSAALNTTNSIAGYSSTTLVNLIGVGNSIVPLLAVNPNTVTFQGVITGQNKEGVNQSGVLTNLGNAPLTISSLQFSLTQETGGWVTPNMSADGTAAQVGAFTFYNLPKVIPALSSAYIPINFNPTTSGSFAAFMRVNSDGGSGVLDVFGSSGTNPKILIQFQSVDGNSWVNYTKGVPFDFGNVYQQTTVTRKMRFTNIGGPNAAALSVTVSKPPYGVDGIIGAVNNIDLAEGTVLQAGESQTADLYCSVPKSQVNVDSYNGTAQWTLNTGDPDSGKQFIQFFCNAIAQQWGPLANNGSALYRYTGCAVENNPGRQLSVQVFGSDSTTNELCINTCRDKGYVIAGTQYRRECWCGNTMPKSFTIEDDCSYDCTGNDTEICGGNGQFRNSGPFISIFATNGALPNTDNSTATTTPAANNGANTAASTANPSIPASIGNYAYRGCYSEASTGRALTGKAFASDTVSLDVCAATCAGFGYWGVEYGRECFCGDSLADGSTKAGIPETDCNFKCPGNSSQICGAGNRLTMYQLDLSLANPQSNSTNSSTTSAPATSRTATSISATPTVTGTVMSAGNFSYFGCVTEATSMRALSAKSFYSDSLTVEMCASVCGTYQLMGVEYGRECYCKYCSE